MPGSVLYVVNFALAALYWMVLCIAAFDIRSRLEWDAYIFLLLISICDRIGKMFLIHFG